MGGVIPVALSTVALEDTIMLAADSDVQGLIRFVNCVHTLELYFKGYPSSIKKLFVLLGRK